MYKNISQSTEPLHCWRFRPSDLAETPSIKAGLSPSVEAQLRRAGCAYICAMAEKLFEPE